MLASWIDTSPTLHGASVETRIYYPWLVTLWVCRNIIEIALCSAIVTFRVRVVDTADFVVQSSEKFCKKVSD
jgi:hypothetical protein